MSRRPAALPHRHDFEEMFTVLDGEIEVTFRGATTVARAGDRHAPANAPHVLRNLSDRPAPPPCMRSPPGQEDFFMAYRCPVASRTEPPPSSTRWTECIHRESRRVVRGTELYNPRQPVGTLELGIFWSRRDRPRLYARASAGCPREPSTRPWAHADDAACPSIRACAMRTALESPASPWQRRSGRRHPRRSRCGMMFTRLVTQGAALSRFAWREAGREPHAWPPRLEFVRSGRLVELDAGERIQTDAIAIGSPVSTLAVPSKAAMPLPCAGEDR